MSNHATLSEAQLGIWLGHQRSEEPALFNAAEFVMLEGPLDVPAFGVALHETLREAEALHVAFAEVRGKPCRVPTPFTEFTLERVVLPGASDDALCAHAASLAARPFELE